MIKWLILAFIAVIVVAFIVLFVVTRVEMSQAKANEPLINEPLDSTTTNSKVAVVVFSRSGNTAVLAHHIANKHKADLLFIEASDYDLGLPGIIHALSDARTRVASIDPEIIDLASYDTVYLGSPIWLYSPAPPIWQFASNNDFSNKHVILFNTFNSYFGPEYIQAFEELVKMQGARSFDHRFVKRGRMGSQISTEQMLENFDSLETGENNDVKTVQQ